MRPQLLALVAVGILILAALWVLLDHPPRGTMADGEDGRNDRAAAAAVRPGDAEPAADATADGLGRAAAAAAPGPEDWTRAPGPRFTLRVRHLVTREPIPGIALWIFDPAHHDRAALRAALEETREDWEPHAARFARKVQADERGEVSLPQPQDWYRILGRQGALYGERYHPRGADGEIQTLYLEHDLALRVRAVDGSGAPIPGLPIGLRQGGEDWSYWADQRTTGADGRALFAHLQESPILSDPRAHIELRPAIPLPDPPAVELRLGAIPEEEQLLVLPARGSVLVRLFDADRRPFTGSARVVLQDARGAALQDEFAEDQEFVEFAARGAQSLESVTDQTLFREVGLGMRLTVAVDFDGTENWETIELDGPRAPGERSTADVVQQVLRPFLVVRLLDAEGAPLRDAEINIINHSVAPSRESFRGVIARTDGEGRLRHTIAEDGTDDPPGSRRWLEFLHRPEPDMAAADAVLLGARIEACQAWQDGPNELGELRLDALPLLAGGVVVDAGGAPVAHAEVSLSRRFLRDRGRESWRSQGDSRVDSDRDGRFWIRGFPREGEHRVEARHRDHAMVSTPWIQNGAEHRLEFAGGDFLTGQILRDAALIGVGLRVVLVAPGAEPDGRSRTFDSATVERDGSFRLGPGAPAAADLWVMDDTLDRRVWTVPAVAGHAFSAPSDPRLDPLDLRGRLRLVEVDCHDEQGAPIRGGLNFALGSDPLVVPENWQWTDGSRFGFLMTEEPLHLWVSSDGYKRKDLKVEGNRLDVLLESGPRLRLILDDPGILTLSTQVYAELSLMEDGEEQESWWQHLAEAQVERSLSVAGSYRLRLYLVVQGEEDDWNWISYPTGEEGLSFLLGEVIGEQTVRLPWSAAELEAEIQRRTAGGK